MSALRSDLRLSVSATDRETVAINALRDARERLLMLANYGKSCAMNDRFIATDIGAALERIEAMPANDPVPTTMGA